jgi:hypothetical protein
MGCPPPHPANREIAVPTAGNYGMLDTSSYGMLDK